MKRKVNKVGKGTLTVSLPKNWAKRYGITKGDDLNVQVKGPIMRVSTLELIKKEKTTYDVTGFDRTTIVFLLRHLYRNGEDDIGLVFQDPMTEYYKTKERISVQEVVESDLNCLMGLEIVDQGKDHIQMKSMLNEKEKDIGIFLKKCLMLMKDTIGQIARHNGDMSKQITTNHEALTRFSSYVVRLLKKFGYNNYSGFFFYYSIIESLELLMGYFEDLVQIEKDTLSQEFFHIFGEMYHFFSDFLDAYYRFDMQKAVELNKRRIDLYHEISLLPMHERNLVFSLHPMLDKLLRNFIGSRISGD